MSKQSQMTNFFKQPHNTSTSDNQNSNITKKHNLDTTQNVDEPSLKKVKILKYKDSYIEYGFTYLNENGKDVPQCVICELFSNEHVTKIKKIPMSNDTISRRINTMSNDIENQLSEKIKKSIFYAIQLDESTDINNEAILLMYVSLAEEALQLLIPFSTTYLCENGFSTLTTIKNKTRNRLEISSAMRISLTKSIKPRIDEIISHQQQQPSH
ncbi:SCAN domain-containing protein 3-like [Metopolophium dirhodum]|uniref:SCAN domain-containing protein 3-like n=1 Tax=Metopolophium dirhodum TaxID=44670 RepID=UPI0029903189|nr:SCAN domain-containing protein 3-like [Metopolophium dirhodum]